MGLFRVKGEKTVVHRFDPSCKAAVAALVGAAKTKTHVAVYLSPLEVQGRFEDSAPWCEECCLEIMALLSSTLPSVESPNLGSASVSVRKALADAELLLRQLGPTSAVDRVHTALHGYLKAVCASGGVPVDDNASTSHLFSLLHKHHRAFEDKGKHQQNVLKSLRALGAIIDALNTARNRGSLAHPNEDLLDADQARLFVNAARTVMQYVEARVSRHHRASPPPPPGE